MKGLLYKDLLTLWKAKLLPIYMVLVVIMPLSSAQNTLMMLFPCFFAATLPMTLLSYDEKSHWDRYVQGLPVTRAQSVCAKYMMAVCLVVSFSLLSTVSKTIAMAVQGQGGVLDSVVVFLLVISAGLFINAMIMPFVFKFGAEKGAIIYYATFGVCGMVVGLFYGFNGLDYTNSASMSPVVAMMLLLVAVIIFVLSWRLSVRFYEKREL